MADLALFWNIDPDISIEEGNAIIDGGLPSAVYLSLAIDANADRSPAWWGGSVDPDMVGSRISTVSKNEQEGREQIRSYIHEALSWLTEDRVAQSVTVEITSFTANRVNYAILIRQPGDTQETIEVYWDLTARRLSGGL